MVMRTATLAGAAVALSSEKIETVVHDLERALLGVDETLAGRLRVTTMDVMTHYHPDLFTSFGERYPEVQLEVEAGDHEDLIEIERDEFHRLFDGFPHPTISETLMDDSSRCRTQLHFRQNVAQCRTSASRSRRREVWMQRKRDELVGVSVRDNYYRKGSKTKTTK